MFHYFISNLRINLKKISNKLNINLPVLLAADVDYPSLRLVAQFVDYFLESAPYTLISRSGHLFH